MSGVTRFGLGVAGAVLLATGVQSQGARVQGAAPTSADPHADLEQIDGAAAMAKVKAWNARTLDTLEKQPGFAAYRTRALSLLSDDRKIARPDQVVAGQVLNFWQDAAHPRGLWRESPLAAFAAGRPEWRTLIDIDALGKAEGRRWVFKGATCLSPAYATCMVALSDGGGDAVVEREFDRTTARFVADGFVLPMAKSAVSWAGPDALYVGTDFGPGSKTDSGYPRIVKLWKRGTPLSAATLVSQGLKSDVSVNVRVVADGDRRWPMLVRGIDFYHHRLSHIAPDGRLVPSPLPDDADVEDVLDGRVIATLKSAWAGRPAGALVAYAIPDLLAGGQPKVETLFVPNAHQAIEEVAAGGSVVWVKLLDDVSGRLLALSRDGDGAWSERAVALPDTSTIHLDAAVSDSAAAFATVEGMLTPPTLYRVTPDGAPAQVQALPARFDASNMVVEQHFATSKDGTKIPYFLVRRKDLSGPAPAYIHAYGGFELAQTPGYLVNEPYRSGPAALFWVEEGNAYVLANIRGGGEYGPRWHDAALREKRQNAYDDLFAVAEDLVRNGVSAKGRIAVSGRSNGGLMAAVAMTQRPDLFGAAVIGSPLIDMKRFSHLLAGASWMGEYGDPDVPADWTFISRYSPYQNLRPGAHYPTPFIYTSTRDDRVHPGHARKFAARLEDEHDPFLYYEATEGGHAAGVEPAEDALRAALVTSYLNLELPRSPASLAADWNARFLDLAAGEYAWRLHSFAEPEGEGQERMVSPHLPDVSPEAQAGRLAEWRKVEAELAHIPQDALTPENRINLAVYKGQVDALLADQQFREWQKPANSDSSFWSDLNSFGDKPLRSEQEYRNYLSQLSEVPRYFDQQIANMRAGEARGFTPPKATLQGRDQSIAMVANAKSPEDTGFWGPFKAMPGNIPADRQAALRDEARRVIVDSVIPAYGTLLAYWRDDYAPHANPVLAAEKLPDGKAYYQSKIREFTTLDLTPDQIHRIGLDEAAKIHAEMLATMKEAGFQGDFPAFLQFLRTDPQFYAKTPDELLKDAAWIAKEFDGKASIWFGRLPRARFAIEPVPAAIAPFYTAGRGGPGVYLVNTHDLPSRPLYQLPALTLHESAPGHAFQISLAAENKDQPAWRRTGYISAYGEGWALYCERLGAEMGLYKTPYERFGMLSYQMWRAARLVVDTGIHHLGWTREQALAYLHDNTALSDHEIATEVDRYISWPGQALSYYLGEKTIRDDRARAERALGPKFDLRAFHDAILQLGSVPMSAVDARTDQFIADGGKGPYPDVE